MPLPLPDANPRWRNKANHLEKSTQLEKQQKETGASLKQTKDFCSKLAPAVSHVRTSIQLHELILLATQTYLFGILQRVHALTGINTFDEMYLPVVLGIADQVRASLVQGDRVE